MPKVRSLAYSCMTTRLKLGYATAQEKQVKAAMKDADHGNKNEVKALKVSYFCHNV